MSREHADIIDLLETIADNKFVLGDKLAEIGVSGPGLEATHSAIALAQSELGHARHLYNWSFELKGISEEVSSQSGKAFQSILNIDNWISLMAAVYVFDTAVEVVMQELLDTRELNVETRASKLLKELREPIVFSGQWSYHLLNDKGVIPEKFVAALNENEQEVTNWLKQVGEQKWLKGNSKAAALLNKFQTNVQSLPKDKIEVP
jgi:ring-1,2-phenylacetyl-CoA epoxidase subunit PaaC